MPPAIGLNHDNVSSEANQNSLDARTTANAAQIPDLPPASHTAYGSDEIHEPEKGLRTPLLPTGNPWPSICSSSEPPAATSADLALVYHTLIATMTELDATDITLDRLHALHAQMETGPDQAIDMLEQLIWQRLHRCTVNLACDFVLRVATTHRPIPLHFMMLRQMYSDNAMVNLSRKLRVEDLVTLGVDGVYHDMVRRMPAIITHRKPSDLISPVKLARFLHAIIERLSDEYAKWAPLFLFTYGMTVRQMAATDGLEVWEGRLRDAGVRVLGAGWMIGDSEGGEEEGEEEHEEEGGVDGGGDGDWESDHDSD